MAFASRVMFMTPPEVGKSYPFGDRVCTVTGEEEYARARDGQPTRLMLWETTCTDCDDKLTFKTGATAGDIVMRCISCRRAAAETKADRARRDRTCETPAPAVIVWRALRALLLEEGPQPMSLARNTSRNALYAPAMLRRAAPELLDSYTLEDIHQGLEDAMRRGFIGWQTAGRYGSGNARRGLFARPEAFLRQAGLLPSTTATETPADVFA